MRLDWFSEGDSVLLLGEGNFSFATCLHKHKLPIKIVATCFESEAVYEGQLENIEYLRSNEVPVFFNVDATRLRENPLFSGGKFSKIIFNFPHVGGKMKIHLNRELLRKAFESCSHVLSENGLVIVSLCRGQGGTPADHPRRSWNDSWQITEMAAHGDFVLTAVEPFLPSNFSYRCVGYRGQDVHFHLPGALVHVFSKRPPPFAPPHHTLSPSRLTLSPLCPLHQNPHLLVSPIYSDFYRNNPLTNPRSPLSFLARLLLQSLPPKEEGGGGPRLLHDEDLPFHVEKDPSELPGGAPCQVDGVRRTLRRSPLDVLPYWEPFLGEKVLFPGTYFRPLGRDFAIAPVQVRFVLTGEGLSFVKRFLEGLIDLFGEEEAVLSEGQVDDEGGSRPGLILEKRSTRVVAAILYEGEGVCVVNGEEICEFLFAVDGRDLWAEGTEVVEEGEVPTVRRGSLYPSEYQFDLTVRYTEAYPEDRLYEVLWLAAGQVIEGVEPVSEYVSEEGWSSKCYRIRYRSRDRALFRRRVVELHSEVVGRVVEMGLGVVIG